MHPIEHDLLSNGYSREPINGVFRSVNYSDIAYNDGDESENRILNAIKNAVDIDSLSDELEGHCIDWPSTYHLSKKRGNLLRPFSENFKDRTILEIGSGMGPITRLLGESGADVLALEGTSRRASATRSRTRDLPNVFVLAERFDEFKSEIKFDFITLIGVLEYSNLYVEGPNPHLGILKQCFEMLKPDGSLIVAIENKLGLKYFAGANEDHVGIPMYGLENRYHGKSVRTFGKLELENLLSLAGFKINRFNAPLPDYKLTTSVISESGFADRDFKPEDLMRDAFGSDPQLPASLAFTPELVLQTLSQNNLGLEFANSFLVIASKNSDLFVNKSQLAWHFSTSRRKRYCVKTVFYRSSPEKIQIKKSKMSSSTSLELITQNISENSPYREGRLFRDDLELLLATPSWRHADLKRMLQTYEEFLLRFRSATPTNLGEKLLVAKSIDLIPRNIVITPSQEWEAFDFEWEAMSPVDLRHVLFRAVLSLHTTSIFSHDEFGAYHTLHSLFKLVCTLLDLEVTEDDILNFSGIELDYQNEIAAYSGNIVDFKNHLLKPMGRGKFQPNLLTVSSLERDGAIAERDGAIAERDGAVAVANAERDGAIAERDGAIAERVAIVDSTIWKSFKPYRAIIKLIKGL